MKREKWIIKNYIAVTGIFHGCILPSQHYKTFTFILKNENVKIKSVYP